MVAFRGGSERIGNSWRKADCVRLGPNCKCKNGTGGYEVVLEDAIGQEAQLPALQGVSALDSDFFSEEASEEEEAEEERLALEG